MKPKPTTTIQVKRETADALSDVGAVMRQIFPDLFASVAPTKDTVIGFLIGSFMEGLSESDIHRLRADWVERQAGRN